MTVPLLSMEKQVRVTVALSLQRVILKQAGNFISA